MSAIVRCWCWCCWCGRVRSSSTAGPKSDVLWRRACRVQAVRGHLRWGSTGVPAQVVDEGSCRRRKVHTSCDKANGGVGGVAAQHHAAIVTCAPDAPSSLGHVIRLRLSRCPCRQRLYLRAFREDLVWRVGPSKEPGFTSMLELDLERGRGEHRSCRQAHTTTTWIVMRFHVVATDVCTPAQH